MSSRNRCAVFVCLAFVFGMGVASAQVTSDYRVLATSKTSTMEKEMQEAAADGFRFAAVMGGETAIGKEVVVLMQQASSSEVEYEYRLLATNKTSTMERELQEAGDAGFVFVGQTVFESFFGGKEVVSILERNPAAPVVHYTYKLIATSKTSTLQKELTQIGLAGYEALGMTVGQTALGGNEMVVITRKRSEPE